MSALDGLRGATQSVLASAGPRLIGPPEPWVLDEFDRWAGPDVALGFGQPVRVFVIFSVDPDSRDLRAAVVDEAGRLLRLIPSSSVGQMLAAMAAYSR